MQARKQICVAGRRQARKTWATEWRTFLGGGSVGLLRTEWEGPGLFPGAEIFVLISATELFRVPSGENNSESSVGEFFSIKTVEDQSKRESFLHFKIEKRSYQSEVKQKPNVFAWTD